MRGYAIKTDDLSVSTRGGGKSSPLKLSANPYIDTLKPIGLVVVEGDVYKTSADGLPALVAYENGGVDITFDCTLSDVVTARFIISGSALLVSNYKLCEIESQLDIRAKSILPRMGVGLMDDGRLLFLVLDGTPEDLQLAFSVYPVRDAMMLAYNDIFVQETSENIQRGKLPLTVFEAINYDAISYPVVVIDPGHGGTDTGVKAFDLEEKTITLAMAQYIRDYLDENYVGTFLLTRNSDVDVPSDARCKIANAVGADFLLSIHVDSSPSADTEGYSTFICPQDSNEASEIQLKLHSFMMDFFHRYQVSDRGKKVANIGVLRDTFCPAVLVENLFITNPTNARWLSDSVWLQGFADATAEATARALELSHKLTSDEYVKPAVTYKVSVGNFTYRKGADALMRKLKDAGFEGTLVTERTKKE